MLGNVLEWVADWYWYYPPDNVTDPHGTSSGTYRLLRSGAWTYNTVVARASHRGWANPAVPKSDTGFRCAGSLLP
jgi:formylglycine-generating enzyme required for sulfatase activity